MKYFLNMCWGTDQTTESETEQSTTAIQDQNQQFEQPNQQNREDITEKSKQEQISTAELQNQTLQNSSSDVTTNQSHDKRPTTLSKSQIDISNKYLRKTKRKTDSVKNDTVIQDQNQQFEQPNQQNQENITKSSETREQNDITSKNKEYVSSDLNKFTQEQISTAQPQNQTFQNSSSDLPSTQNLLTNQVQSYDNETNTLSRNQANEFTKLAYSTSSEQLIENVNNTESVEKVEKIETKPSIILENRTENQSFQQNQVSAQVSEVKEKIETKPSTILHFRTVAEQQNQNITETISEINSENAKKVADWERIISQSEKLMKENEKLGRQS